MEDPTLADQYTYCSAYDNSFLSTSLALCEACLREANEAFLSNFLIALQAGCIQRPPPGTLVGLDGTLFSQWPVNITSVIVLPGLHQHLGTALGIGLGIVFLCLTIIVAGCLRRYGRKGVLWKLRQWNQSYNKLSKVSEQDLESPSSSDGVYDSGDVTREEEPMISGPIIVISRRFDSVHVMSPITEMEEHDADQRGRRESGRSIEFWPGDF